MTGIGAPQPAIGEERRSGALCRGVGHSGPSMLIGGHGRDGSGEW